MARKFLANSSSYPYGKRSIAIPCNRGFTRLGPARCPTSWSCGPLGWRKWPLVKLSLLHLGLVCQSYLDLLARSGTGKRVNSAISKQDPIWPVHFTPR